LQKSTPQVKINNACLTGQATVDLRVSFKSHG